MGNNYTCDVCGRVSAREGGFCGAPRGDGQPTCQGWMRSVSERLAQLRDRNCTVNAWLTLIEAGSVSRDEGMEGLVIALAAQVQEMVAREIERLNNEPAARVSLTLPAPNAVLTEPERAAKLRADASATLSPAVAAIAMSLVERAMHPLIDFEVETAALPTFAEGYAVQPQGSYASASAHGDLTGLTRAGWTRQVMKDIAEHTAELRTQDAPPTERRIGEHVIAYEPITLNAHACPRCGVDLRSRLEHRAYCAHCNPTFGNAVVEQLVAPEPIVGMRESDPTVKREAYFLAWYPKHGATATTHYTRDVWLDGRHPIREDAIAIAKQRWLEREQARIDQAMCDEFIAHAIVGVDYATSGHDETSVVVARMPTDERGRREVVAALQQLAEDGPKTITVDDIANYGGVSTMTPWTTPQSGEQIVADIHEATARLCGPQVGEKIELCDGAGQWREARVVGRELYATNLRWTCAAMLTDGSTNKHRFDAESFGTCWRLPASEAKS